MCDNAAGNYGSDGTVDWIEHVIYGQIIGVV